MDFSKVLNYKEFHFQILRILYLMNDNDISVKDIITKFISTLSYSYSPTNEKREKYKVTDAKIYATLKFLEKEQLVKKTEIFSTNRSTTFYTITDEGKSLISQQMSLSIQNIISYLLPAITIEKSDVIENFVNTYSKPGNAIGIIGPGNPLGQSILSLFFERLKDVKIYYIDFDPILEDEKSNKEKIFTTKTNFHLGDNVEYRSCFMENDRLRLDVGNNQLNIVFSMMLLSNFPRKEVVESSLTEISRVLRKDGVVLFQEIRVQSSFLMWVISKLTAGDNILLPVVFYNLINRERLSQFLELEGLNEMISSIFTEVEIDELAEILFILARKE